VTCDIDHVTPGTRELLQLVSHPVFAESVPTQLTGEADLEHALRALRRGHPGRLVVTVGEKGAIALDGSALLAAPGFPVTVVDSTGAGDVFRGGYIYGIVKDGRSSASSGSRTRPLRSAAPSPAPWAAFPRLPKWKTCWPGGHRPGAPPGGVHGPEIQR